MEGVCCNPFNTHSHAKFTRDKVRRISENLQSKAHQIGIALGGSYICNKCRQRMHNEWTQLPVNVDSNVEIADDEPMDMVLDDTEMTVEESQQPVESVHGEPSSSQSIDMSRLRARSQSQQIDAQKPDDSSESSGASEKKQSTELESSGSEVIFDPEVVQEAVNNLLIIFNQPVLDKEKLRTAKYSTEQLYKLITLLRKTVFDNATEKENFGNEMVLKLKKKFHDESTDRSTKFKIVSVLPDSWTARKVEQEMGTTFYIANKSKQLETQHGAFFDIAKKIGFTKLSPETVLEVNKFYNDERFSRLMPGIKDYKIVRENGDKVKVQRRLLIMNLKELYEEFKEEFPNMKIGFSTFAALKPLECLTSIDANGIHCVCVCTYHQNVELNCNALKYICPELSKYRDCLNRMICAYPNNDCYMLKCKNCPGEGPIHDLLMDVFLQNEIEEITFKQWTSFES